MAKLWKAAVIGCGSIAEHLHVPGYLRTPDVDLVAVCDPNPERLEAMKGLKADVRTYGDYRQMLASEKPDVVSVSSPNRFHMEQAVAALRHGAHVILEKPAALSMKEIARIRKAVKDSGRKLVVGFSHRFKRGNRCIREQLRAKVIGEPYMLRIRFAHAGPLPGWAKDDWFYEPENAGGGAMLDMGVHAFDLAQWFLGPVRSVQAIARTLRKPIPLDDVALLLLEFENPRVLGYIEVGWTSPAGWQGVEIMGDKGYIVEDYAGAGTVTVTRGMVTPDVRKKVVFESRVVERQAQWGGWDVEVQEIVAAFRKNSDLDCGIDAGGAALAVALAAYESSRTGRRVRISEARKVDLAPKKRPACSRR